MINIKLKSFFIIIFILIISSTTVSAVTYTVQTGYFSKESNAQNLSQKLVERGLDVYKYKQSNRYFVFVGNFTNYNSAQKILNEIQNIVKEAYVRKVDFNFTEDKVRDKNGKKEINKEQKNTQINEDKKDNLNEEIIKDENPSNEKAKENKNNKNIKEAKTEKKLTEILTENKELAYYKNNETYNIKSAFLEKNGKNNAKFLYPNGTRVDYSIDNFNGKVQNNSNYYLVFKDDEIVNLFKQENTQDVFYTLKDFGYNNDIYLRGWENSFVLNIPLSDKIIEEKVYLKLNLKTSKFINELSAIDILINNRHVKQYNFKTNSNNYKLLLPINLGDINNLKLEIKAKIRNGEKNFSPALYENMWIKIDNTSGVEFKLKNNQTYQLNNFLGIEATKINLFYEGKLSRQEFHDYIKLYTYLNRIYNNLPPSINLKSSAKEIDFNNYNNRVRNIVVSEDFQETKIDETMTLLIAPEDIDFILSDFLKLINANYLDVNKYNLKQEIDYKLSSFKIDSFKANRKGWGEINYQYHLPINLFNNWPKDLNLHLTGSYFIPFDNPAYLKVYINNKLVYSEKLEKSSYFKDKLVTIEGSELEQINDLKIQFSQYPSKILSNYSNLMETYINPESYFSVAGNLYKKNTFENLVNNFKGNGQILVDENNSDKLLKTTALLFGSIHEEDSIYNNFNVNYYSNYNFDNNDNKNWYIIIGEKRANSKFNSKIALDNDRFLIKNSEEIITEFKTNNNLSYIDLTKYNDKEVMIINSNNINSLESMLNKVIANGGINDLNGDLLVFNDENYQTFQILKEKQPKLYKGYLNDLKTLLEENKRYIYLAAIILLVLLLIWIYYRTSRQKTKEK